MSFKITYRTHILCFIMSFVLSLLLTKQIDFMIDGWFLSVFFNVPTKFIILNYILYLAAMMIPVSIVHEFFHGIAYKALGYTVSYGFIGIYAYTKETSGKPISRNKFLIVLLTPAMIISLFSLLLGGHLAISIFVLNLLGSSGDILMAIYLTKHNSTVKIIDRDYGFDII